MRPLFALVAAGLACLALPASAADPAKSWDGLVEVKSKRFDAGFLSPGVDFRSYNRVMLDNPEVAFRKDWMRSMNSYGTPFRVRPDDAEKILEAVRTNTSDIFAEEFAKGGYQVATAPAADVLRVRSAVIDLYVNAPDTMTAGRSRSYTSEAGEATLVLELRDSLTNALLARVLDRRETQGLPGVSNSITNLSEYRNMARQWARISVKGLDNLKAHSPVPATLTPNQQLD